MIFRKLIFFLTLFFCLNILSVGALDFYDGNIRLRVNEKNGSFSLYYLSDPASSRYEPLFNAKEPKASALSVNINRVVYKLGESRSFRVRVETLNDFPIIFFEASGLTVSQAFTPVKTLNSYETNGIMMTVTITNIGEKAVSAGLRTLLDTHLGEKNKDGAHFVTNNQIITSEALFRGATDELFWISKNQDYSLMGSIFNPLDITSKVPDYVHFANWRRFYNKKWELDFSRARSFNYWPYAPNDSAVCYFYEPASLEAGSSFTYNILLTVEDLSMYNFGSAAYNYHPAEDDSQAERARGSDALNIDAADYGGVSNNNSKLLLMYMLQETLNRFLAGEIYLNDNDLDQIERSINELR